jgi:hypothetical protein
MHAFDQPDRSESGGSPSVARSGGRGRDSDSNSPASCRTIDCASEQVRDATGDVRRPEGVHVRRGRGVSKENTQVFLTYEEYKPEGSRNTTFNGFHLCYKYVDQ